MCPQQPSPDALAPRPQQRFQGRAAIFGSDPVLDAPRRTSPKWEEVNRRVTFYCPIDLLYQIETAVANSRASKSAIITEALRQYLAADGTEPRFPRH